MESNENVSTLTTKNCPQTLAPPRSQVEELQPILSNNKNYLYSIPRENTRRTVTFKNCESARQSSGTNKQLHPSSWKPWSEFRPDESNQENFAGNYRGDAAARKIANRKARRKQARSERTTGQAEVAEKESALNRINYISNCRRRTEKESERELLCGVDHAITHAFKEVNASANTILMEIQTLLDDPTTPSIESQDKAANSITDGEAHDELRDGLCAADVQAMDRDELEGVHANAGYGATLSTEQLRKATIAGDIPSIILDSGASSTCVKPPAEEMQTSECGEHVWNPPLTATGKQSNKVFSMALGHTANAGEIMECNALPL